jgi:hypothetical protein
MVDKPDAAVQSLRQNGLMVSLLEVLAVEVPNQPGALQTIADALGRRQLNLDNCSGFVTNDRAILIVEAHDLAQAREALREQKLRLLSQEEMQRL